MITVSPDDPYLACSREQCCSPTGAMMRTGSERLQPRGAHGPTFRRVAIATIRSALARISIEPGISWSGSSTNKHCRRVATRYDKLAANYLAFVQLASIRLWLRA